MRYGFGWMRGPALVCLAAAIAACSRTPAPPSLAEVPKPDLARFDPSVQTQITARYAALTRTRETAGAADAQLGAAFGAFGMVMHAAEQIDQAEPAYGNAEALMPADPRWPYYRALVRRAKGDAAGAATLLTRTLELRPGDLPALVGLGRAYLDQGRLDQAEPIFTRAQVASPKAVAVLTGLATIALARKDFTRAISLLEEGLTTDPGAHSLHAQLAMAYRGLGDTTRAEAHQRLWRNTEVEVPDPLREEMTLTLESGLSYDLRGARAMVSGDYAAAADLFGRGVALTSGSTQLGRSLRHKRATALFVQGQTDAAITGFEDVIRLEPPGELDDPSAKAHYSLGVVRASSGRSREAIAHFTRAVALSPAYLEARVALGDALRAANRDEPALAHYIEAARISPRAADARLGYAIGLVRLGRFAEARDWLAESVGALPDRPELAHTLARLLVSAPDAGVRDGQRALPVIDTLFTSFRTPYVAETMAMTLAELGRFDDAVALQRSLVASAKQGGTPADVTRTAGNLALYERRQPCRTPWPDDDPIYHPVPGTRR